MPEKTPDNYRFGPFRFEVHDGRLLRDDHPIDLTPKSALLLRVLLEADGRVVSRRELNTRIWAETNVGPGSLLFQVHALRKVIGDDKHGERLIENIPRRGYRLAIPIEAVTAPDEAEPAAVTPGPSAAPGDNPAPRVAPSRIWLKRLGYVMAFVAVLIAAAWRPRPTPRIVRYAQVSHDGFSKRGPLKVDASHVYYRDIDDRSLTSVPIGGGESTRLPLGHRDKRIVDLSPARAEYLAVSLANDHGRWALWALPMKAGSPRRVGEARCHEAVWSPRADRIACTNEVGLLAFDNDGRSVQTLAVPAAGTVHWPRWSPDGRRLRFTVHVAANRLIYKSLWEVSADGSHLRQLLTDWQTSRALCCGSWSPDGRHFVFVSEDNDRTDLWILRDHTNDDVPVRLTNGPLLFLNPVWTGDGRQVLALGRHDRGELVRYDLNLHAFVPFLGGLSATWLNFSRDGAWVAYSSFPDKALWRARSDGSERLQLTVPMDVQELSWSPDGKSIAFRTETGADPTKLYVIDRNGGAPRVLPPPSQSFGMPTWSPDGTRLVTSDVPGAFGQPEGTEAIRIYDFSRSSWSIVSGGEELWRARWSPDGRYIAALTIRGQQLRLFDTRTGVWRKLDADHINSPTWSRDSRYIYYDTEGGIYSLRRVRIVDGHVEELASLASFSRAAYWWSGLSPDDAPILLRDIGAIEIYALDIERD